MKKRIEIELQPGEVATCPNCGGTGDDPETMICCLCGGDGVLEDEPLNEGPTIAIRNCRDYHPQPFAVTDIWVARPSALGNPFKIGVDGDREEVIARYATWLAAQLAEPTSKAARKMAATLKLLKKHGHLTLVCWCAPERCHAEIIRDHLLGASDE